MWRRRSGEEREQARALALEAAQHVGEAAGAALAAAVGREVPADARRALERTRELQERLQDLELLVDKLQRTVNSLRGKVYREAARAETPAEPEDPLAANMAWVQARNGGG